MHSLAVAQASQVFVAPPQIEFERWRQVREDDFVEKYTLDFLSAISTAYPKNDEVPLTVFLPKNRVGKTPVILVLHYWGASDSRLEDDFCDLLAKRGIASVQLALPYHYDRAPDGTKSGELAIQPDPILLRAFMIQAISDIQRTVDWMESRDEFDLEKIGIAGTSLGAVITSLAFAIEPRFKACSFLLGGADLAYILWHSSRVVQQRDALRFDGYTEEKLREILRDIEPLNYLSPLDTRPTYVVRARHDTVMPAEATSRLISKLANHQELVLETGHYGGVLVQNKVMRSLANFFTSSFSGEKFNAPQIFYSPTVRAAVIADPIDGLNLGLGLDVWRSNDASSYFASAFLTPNGLRGYIGGKLNRDFSIGVMIHPRRTTVGFMWSVVF